MGTSLFTSAMLSKRFTDSSQMEARVQLPCRWWWMQITE